MNNHDRELSDIEQSTIMEILEFMSQHSNFSELCRFMILDLLAKYEPWGACIGSCNSSGRIEILGSYGVGEGLLEQYESASCLGMPSSTGVFFNGQSVDHELAVNERGATSPLFHIMNSHGPNVIGLIEQNSQLVGYVQILFFHPLESLELVSSLNAITLACRAELILHRMYSKSVTPFPIQNPASNAHKPSFFQSEHLFRSGLSSESVELTVRQLEILNCISTGMTNSGIARKIGFSESTVRQETISIYRKLGVSNRKEAAEIGRMNGLIPIKSTVFV